MALHSGISQWIAKVRGRPLIEKEQSDSGGTEGRYSLGCLLKTLKWWAPRGRPGNS